MTDPNDDLAALVARIDAGRPTETEAAPTRTPKPIYLLEVDAPDDRAIVLIVRTSKDGVTRSTIALPEWHELPEGWDGPHEMDVAIPLADSYAWEYGYHAIAIDIESSQLWDFDWGPLTSSPENFD